MKNDEYTVNMSAIVTVLEKLRLIIATVMDQVNEPASSSYRESLNHFDKAISGLEGVTNECFDPAIWIDSEGILHIGGVTCNDYLSHDDIHALKTLGKL